NDAPDGNEQSHERDREYPRDGRPNGARARSGRFERRHAGDCRPRCADGLQAGDHFLGRFGPGGWAYSHALLNQVAELSWQFSVHLIGAGWHLPLKRRDHAGQPLLTWEWMTTSRSLEHHHPEGVQVRSLIDGFTLRLFGGHVERSTHDAAGPGQVRL